MSTLNSHQEFKKGYNVPEGEEKYFHILFVDRHVNMKSKTVSEKFSVQKYKPGEWRVIQKHIETPGIGIKVTGHDEFSILHDPIAYAEAEKARIEAEEAAKLKEAEAAEKKAKAEKKKEEQKVAAAKKRAEVAAAKKASAEQDKTATDKPKDE